MLRFLSDISLRFRRVPIFNRLLIGNSTVIILGAVGGTLLTRHLTLVGNFNLILLFSGLGLALTLLVNFLIVSSAVRPLRELRAALNEPANSGIVLNDTLRLETEPDIKRLVDTIELMVKRLEQRQEQLQALSQRAINAQEEERNRIARNLHDDTAQSLSALLVHLERMESLLPENSPTLVSRVAQIRRLASQTLEDLRKLIWDLRPAILDDLGLAAAVRWYAGSRLEEAGLEVHFDIPEDSLCFSPALDTTLFRVLQEAVNNILRHARASQVSVGLWEEGGCALLMVEDNGIGFDVSQATGQAVYQNQLGLLGLQERVSLVGGKVGIDSFPGLGTRVNICLPLRDLEKV